MVKKTLNKYERIKSSKEISLLITEGKFLFSANLKLAWLLKTNKLQIPSRFTVSVPKRLIKHAVKRNLLKRRIREAYRLNKSINNNILLSENKSVDIIFIYNTKEILDYQIVEYEVIELLNKLLGLITRIIINP